MAFLSRLKEILAIDNSSEFSRMCEKKRSNMSTYLNGVQKPGPSVLEDCLLNATVSRIFENPPSQNTRLGKKTKRVREGVGLMWQT